MHEDNNGRMLPAAGALGPAHLMPEQRICCRLGNEPHENLTLFIHQVGVCPNANRKGYPVGLIARAIIISFSLPTDSYQAADEEAARPKSVAVLHLRNSHPLTSQMQQTLAEARSIKHLAQIPSTSLQRTRRNILILAKVAWCSAARTCASQHRIFVSYHEKILTKRRPPAPLMSQGATLKSQRLGERAKPCTRAAL